jgi:hypothetical protein
VAPQPDAPREVNAGRGPDAAHGPGAAAGREVNAGRGPGPAPDTRTRAAERSAERAAALAATEGFHPLRIRPYVAEPDDEAGETTVRPLLTSADDGGPATTDLGLFPALYAALEYPAEDGPAFAGTGAGSGAGAGTGPDDEDAAARGRHRRRRRSLVVAAAAVAASALAAGAVAVTGQMTGSEPRTDRAMPPDQSTAMPDVELPKEVAGVTGTASKSAPRHVPAPAVTTTAAASSAPTAPPATPAPSSSPATPATPLATAPASQIPLPSTTVPTTPPVPTTVPAGPQILTLGDNGAAVADLQQRLIDVWVYHEHVDGHFDGDVQQAVATFQIWYGVRGDPPGVYGAATRSVLEHQTD